MKTTPMARPGVDLEWLIELELLIAHLGHWQNDVRRLIDTVMDRLIRYP